MRDLDKKVSVSLNVTVMFTLTGTCRRFLLYLVSPKAKETIGKVMLLNLTIYKSVRNARDVFCIDAL